MKDTKFSINEILSGTLSLTISTLIVKILGVIYKIPLAAILGEEGMGYFNSAYTIYGFFYLLCTAGAPKAVMILVSRCNANGDKDAARKIVQEAIRVFMLIGTVSFAILTILAVPLSSLIGNSRAYMTIIAVAPSIIFISVAAVLRGYLSSNLKLLDIAVSQIIEGVCKLAIGLIAAGLSSRACLPLHVVSAMTILGVSFGSVAGLIYLVITSGIKITKYNTRQNGVSRDLFRISLPITLSAAIMSGTNIIDLGLIMKSLKSIGYSESEAGALYGNYTTMAVPMLGLALAILAPISTAFMPIFSKEIAQNDSNSLMEAEKSAIRISTLVSLPLLFGVAFYSKEILSMLFPALNVELGAALTCLLSPAIFFASILLIVNSSLEAGGKVKAPLISMIIGCLAKIIISYILIRNETIGIMGAPIGTTCSYCISLCVSVIIYNVEYGRNIAMEKGLIGLVLLSLSTVILSRKVYYFLTKNIGNLMSLFVSVFFCAALYFGLFVLYNLFLAKKTGRVAKYTKFNPLNCKLNT